MEEELQARLAKIFPESAKYEEVIIFTRKHWFLFFVVFLILFFMFIVPAIILAIIIRFNPALFSGAMINLVVLVSSMYLLFLCAAFLISFINLYFDVMILTNKRVIDINQKGLFNREINELDLLHVEDVRSNVSGFFGTLFDFGSVEIQTAGTARNFLFNGMPHPREISQKVLEAYKRALELEQFEDAKNLDRAEGFGNRNKHLTYEDIHGFRKTPAPKKIYEEFQPAISEKLQLSGDLKEGEIVDLNIPGANDQVLLKFNLPRTNLDKVLEFLPALKSPTINDLADKNFVAIETVVKKSEIDSVLQKLKEADASGIIQTDIKVL